MCPQGYRAGAQRPDRRTYPGAVPAMRRPRCRDLTPARSGPCRGDHGQAHGGRVRIALSSKLLPATILHRGRCPGATRYARARSLTSFTARSRATSRARGPENIDIWLDSGRSPRRRPAARFVEREIEQWARSCTKPARRGLHKIRGSRKRAAQCPRRYHCTSDIHRNCTSLPPPPARCGEAQDHSTRAITRAGLPSAPFIFNGRAIRTNLFGPICERLVMNWINGMPFLISAR